MNFTYSKVAGGLLFVGGVQFVVGMFVAEALYPEYSISQNFISDLGVGSAAFIFNSSVILLGLMVIVSAYFIERAFRTHMVAVLFGLSGAGAIGVGVFPENFELIHLGVSFVAFLFGGLSAIAAYKLEKTPLSHFSVIMGVISLSALALFLTETFLGLGQGGMERMIVYPILLWVTGFGGYLMGCSQTAITVESRAAK
jgi:hypothetical membrane protein